MDFELIENPNGWMTPAIHNTEFPQSHGINLAMWQNKHTFTDGKVFLWDTKNNIYSYGLWEPNPMNRPGHGGLWSSRASVLGAILKQPMFECLLPGDGYYGSGFAVSGDVVAYNLSNYYRGYRIVFHTGSFSIVKATLVPNFIDRYGGNTYLLYPYSESEAIHYMQTEGENIQ